ncbi:hypothetical protein HPB51_005751 [Rhipicephalus microplus]|uniref:Uncharacterized protein n=1 Tax=Rhipicephalus microplus TaxID=6941 RepID=A0A9J6DTR0_RHIMP|nr:hypothetical protein HPB51_005751 [Rhipicephalus microplus]
MLATFMGYFYTMKSELDAMVVVIGIQKRRSLLGGDESPHDTAPPQFPSSASTDKVRDARNLTQKPNGAADQGLLKFTSSVASADHQDCSVMPSCNRRHLSSLPSVIHSKHVPEEASMVPAQSTVERSRSTGHSGLSGAFQCDLARAVDAIPPPGQRRIEGSRQSSLESGLTTTSTKVSASRLPKSTVQSQQDVIAGMSSPGLYQHCH